MAKGLRLTQEQYAHLMGKKPMAGVNIDKAHRAKFGNVKTDGFDSKKESRRHQELVMLERAGKISGLALQVPFACVVAGIHICDYVADFTYMEGERRVVEDVKSEATRKLPVYRLKRKLVLACHGIQISET
jgi:hypothetical protein